MDNAEGDRIQAHLPDWALNCGCIKIFRGENNMIKFNKINLIAVSRMCRETEREGSYCFSSGRGYKRLGLACWQFHVLLENETMVISPS